MSGHRKSVSAGSSETSLAALGTQTPVSIALGFSVRWSTTGAIPAPGKKKKLVQQEDHLSVFSRHDTVIIIVVISIAPHLANISPHLATAHYKINNNVYMKTSKIIFSHNIVFLTQSDTHLCAHAHTRAHTHTHTHTQVHRRNITRGEGG